MNEIPALYRNADPSLAVCKQNYSKHRLGVYRILAAFLAIYRQVLADTIVKDLVHSAVLELMGHVPDFPHCTSS